MDERIRRVAGGLLILALLTCILATTSASAAEGDPPTTGVLEGTVINATTGKPVPSVQARLYWARGQEPQPERTAKADAQGRYRFTNLPVSEEYAYVVYAVHEGVEYTSPRVQLTSKAPKQAVELEVYGSSPLDSAVRIKSASFVVLDVNKASQSMFVLQTFVLQNETKQTFRPVVDGPRGPMGLLRFSLPPNASQLSAMGELASRSVIQTDRGFGTDLPVRPGETQVSFTYQVPYRDPSGTLEFDLTLPYPTDEFTLLTPPGDARITSSQLKPAEPVKLFQTPDSDYNSMSAAGLAARSRLSFAAANLPVNIHFFRPDNPWLWVASGVLLLALILTALALGHRHGAALATTGSSPLVAEQAGLVRALAELDAEYERGVLEERAYRRERELRRQRLLALMAAAPEPS